MKPLRRERLTLWSVAEGIWVGPWSLLVVWTQLLLGRRAALGLLASVGAKRTRFKSRTEGIETLHYAEGIRLEGLVVEG